MNYKASVIIPVYNAEKTIERCVESLVFGRERNIQLVLVDDCSKDNSWIICNNLAAQHQNVVAIQNKQNSGVSHTRNHGLQVAAGEYILFMDSDDWASSKFALEMLEAAKNAPNQLVMCGFHFQDNLHENSKEYLWDNSGISEFIVKKEQYFELVNKILIQFVWNKVFRLDIIQKHHIFFDESQSMGEDFQFVLDYMKAVNIVSCFVVNKPLYYYVRANSTSLMSKIGLESYEKKIDRLEQLAILSGKLQTKLYQSQISALKQGHQYQIVHNLNIGKSEKIQKIESVMQDGRAKQYYRKQRILMMREEFNIAKNNIIKFKDRADGWLQRKKRSYLLKQVRRELQAKDFTIISQNCIGGVFYHDMEIQFQSPTINLYFDAADFVKFVLHLKEYMSMKLEIAWGETYPIGKLGDITIYFMHYQTCKEAWEMWEKRKNRIHWDKIVVVSTDREGFTDKVYQQWKQISYPKILFTAQKRFADDVDSVYYPEYESVGSVVDLIPNREFYKNGSLIDTVNKLS